jgi:hypothetical protein
MPELNDLWDWIAYVRETNAFLIALPSFVGFVLACIADRVEAYLTSFSEPVSSHQVNSLENCSQTASSGTPRPAPALEWTFVAGTSSTGRRNPLKTQ